ncbi:MAG TPA: hypothetical protein DCW90_22680 [Lachnospiraceae bacterium]|nr:ABC transporter permease [uncultured Lachnoclostridium sp.]HAU88176.1 hypothetical protein [Lachnospiraceae bacterium]
MFQSVGNCLKLRTKSLFTDYTGCFWCILFPLILATLFCVAIPKNSNDKFSPIRVSVVYSSKETEELYRNMKLAKTSLGNSIFQPELSSEMIARDKLSSGIIDAYIKKRNRYYVICNKENAVTNIIKTYVEWYEESKENSDLNLHMNYVMKECTKENFHKNDAYFLSLLAMAAFLAMQWGIRITTDLEECQSKLGAHYRIVPVARRTLVLQNFLSVCLVELVANLLLDSYIILVRKLKLLSVFSYIFLVQMLTSLVGVLVGVLFCTIVNADLKMKQKWAERFIFLTGFLGGIVFYKVRYTVDVKFPLLGKTNPVNIAADAMFHVYFIKDMKMYGRDIAILLAMVVILIAAEVRIARRKIYARK